MILTNKSRHTIITVVADPDPDLDLVGSGLFKVIRIRILSPQKVPVLHLYLSYSIV